MTEQWSARKLRSRVTHIIQGLTQCNMCVRRRSIEPKAVDYSQHLQQHLDRFDYETVINDPHYYLKHTTNTQFFDSSPKNHTNRLSFPRISSLSPSSNPVKPSVITPKQSKIRLHTPNITAKERKLIETRAFIRKITLQKVENPTKRTKSLSFLLKSSQNRNFKDTILAKNPHFSVFRSYKLEENREKRSENISEISDFLHENMEKRQQKAVKNRESLELQRTLDRQRLELRLSQREPRRRWKLDG